LSNPSDFEAQLDLIDPPSEIPKSIVEKPIDFKELSKLE
jgi:hypothetical protein